MTKALFPTGLLLLALPACDRQEPEPAPANLTVPLDTVAEEPATGPAGNEAVADAPAGATEADDAPPPPARDLQTAVTSGRSIPAAFRGRWAERAAACDRPHEMELDVTADHLRFWESEGEVTQVAAAGPRGVAVTARFTGEGQSWTREHRLSLSGDGERLTIGDVARVRCP